MRTEWPRRAARPTRQRVRSSFAPDVAGPRLHGQAAAPHANLEPMKSRLGDAGRDERQDVAAAKVVEDLLEFPREILAGLDLDGVAAGGIGEILQRRPPAGAPGGDGID